MPQQKKKITPHQSQKLAAANYRKEFFLKMKLIIDTYCGTEIYPLIPQKTIDYIYLCRFTPFKFRADYNSNIPSKLLTDSKVILTAIIKKQKIVLPPHKLEITLDTYYTVVLTIVWLQGLIESTDFKEAQLVKDALQTIVPDETINEKAYHLIYDILYTYNLGESDLQKTLYWYQYDMVMAKTSPCENQNIITVHSSKPESIDVEIDNTTRPAVRLGWAFAFEGSNWLSLKPSALGVKSPFAEIPLKVYIQMHALNRLIERIDCFWTGIIQFNMFISLSNPIIYYDTNNRILIEFTLFGNKAGYFRADIVNGIILIRTFLFITNNGSPEGQLLEKNTGLQKLDKKYLAIDKLSTFMTSDIGNNAEVRKIFISAGCQCLLDLYEKLNHFLTKKDLKFDTDYLLNYINLNPINMPDNTENILSETKKTSK